jgi:hypothetical protein
MLVKPVTFPPGRARLAANFSPTGSEAEMNTIGTVRVSTRRARTAGVLLARMTSGLRLTSSRAAAAVASTSPLPKRMSTRRFWPSLQPSLFISSRKAASSTSHWASSAVVSTPSRRSPRGCCAVAPPLKAAAAVKPRMTSRRLIRAPAYTRGYGFDDPMSPLPPGIVRRRRQAERPAFASSAVNVRHGRIVLKNSLLRWASG